MGPVTYLPKSKIGWEGPTVTDDPFVWLNSLARNPPFHELYANWPITSRSD